jgi:hypothetical protein
LSDVLIDMRDIPADLIEFFEPLPDTGLTDTWTLSPEPFPAAHFATFPTEIPRRCIKAGTSERGCCAACGAPWRRITERGELVAVSERGNHGYELSKRDDSGMVAMSNKARDGVMPGRAYENRTTGWQPGCACDADVVPCTVLDPFAGAGTTGLVADELGRDCTLIELNPAYAEMARQRIYGAAPMFAAVEVA